MERFVVPQRSNRILIFSFDYPPNQGGISRLCAEIARGLVSRGILTQVLSQESMTDTPLIDQLVETIRVVRRRPQREWHAYRALSKRNQGTVVCISGIWYPEGVLAQLAGFKTRVIIALGAELFPPRQRWRRGMWTRLQRLVLERADVVIAISNYTASLVKQVSPKSKVVTVPLAVDHERFSPQDRLIARARWRVTEDQRVLCSVSRIHRFKGHEIVLEAIARIPVEMRSVFVYLIAGKGPDTAYLQSRAEQLGVTECVRWLGFVPETDLPMLYSASDLFILMTRELPEEQSVEGFGLVFLEAQACGTPVVGTRTGGIPDAIAHGEGGWLIEQDDSTELARILLDLHNNSDAFQAMGDKARQRIERECTWSHYIDQFIAELALQGISLDS